MAQAILQAETGGRWEDEKVRRQIMVPGASGIRNRTKNREGVNRITMGVYHLMCLGRSRGTVIGPLTHLAHPYDRWKTDDQRSFARLRPTIFCEEGPGM